jgi:hypothetical protein
MTNYKQLYQIFNDKEETKQMKAYTTEDTASVEDKKQKDMQEALDREENSLETHYHAARKYPHYLITKMLDSEGDWPGSWEIIDKRGGELPKELQGSFTDVPAAIRTLESHLKNKKENNINV